MSTTSPRQKKSPKPGSVPKTEIQEPKKPISRIPSSGNKFIARASRLDPHNAKSSIAQSGLHGWLTFFILASVIFVMAKNTRKLLSTGTLIGIESLIALVDRFDLLPAWLVMSGISFSVVVLQKLYCSKFSKYFNNFVKNSIHFTLLSTYFMTANYFVLDRQWPFVQTSFFLLELLILIMKMHSYFMAPWETRTSNTSPTFSNFLWFLIAPTLVYQFEYPRTDKISWTYFFEKTLSFIGVVSFLHVVVDLYISPVLRTLSEMTALEAIADLIIPFTIVQILIFYLLFDIVCNGIAELTRFADREFYSDWWNSTTFEEYARKWNKPVHEWLLRHVYLECLNRYKIDRNTATFITFLLSSIFHEYVMVMTFRVFKPWLFGLQMLQLPLIVLGKPLKGTGVGNVFFWISLILGIPLLTIIYCRESQLDGDQFAIV